MKAKKSEKFIIRYASYDDVPGMLEIEKSRYEELYENDSALDEVEDRFKKRIAVAKDWMWVAEKDGEVHGFITGQPTDSEPKDFVSWEKSTDNGTLETTFNERGRNIYVVNLDVDRQATKQNAQYMLMAQLGAKAIRKSKDKVIFESRMPAFREYIEKESGIGLKKWNDLSKDEKIKLAQKYSEMRIERNGKSVRKDRLLRFYESGGFKLEKVFANAFKDPESLDFGMLCTGGNPVPKWLRLAPISFLVSKIFERVGKNPELLSRLIG